MSMVKPGDKIKLLSMPDDPDPMPVGSVGIVIAVTTGPFAQISVDWEDNRSLDLIPGVDRFEIITSSKPPSCTIKEE